MLTNTVECPVCKSRYEKDALPYVQCEACKHEFCRYNLNMFNTLNLLNKLFNVNNSWFCLWFYSVCGDDWGYYAKHGTLCSSNGVSFRTFSLNMDLILDLIIMSPACWPNLTRKIAGRNLRPISGPGQIKNDGFGATQNWNLSCKFGQARKARHFGRNAAWRLARPDLIRWIFKGWPGLILARPAFFIRCWIFCSRIV